MNRRSFLAGVALAPVAALCPHAVHPAVATGRPIRITGSFRVGEEPSEYLLPKGGEVAVEIARRVRATVVGQLSAKDGA